MKDKCLIPTIEEYFGNLITINVEYAKRDAIKFVVNSANEDDVVDAIEYIYILVEIVKERQAITQEISDTFDVCNLIDLRRIIDKCKYSKNRVFLANSVRYYIERGKWLWE